MSLSILTKLLQNGESAINTAHPVGGGMKPMLERGSDGKMRLSKDGKRRGRLNARALAMGLAVVVVAVALVGMQAAIAEGDKVRHTYGEDDGYYDVNNNNEFTDEDFPGLDTQNRTGVV